LKIVADENMPLVESFFAGWGDIERVSGRGLTAQQVADADVLLVRSVTEVNEALLADSKVQFVGTATVGVDHVDQAYLSRAGIGFSSAPGCNAYGVVDYVLSTLARLSRRETNGFLDRRVGIVGAGNVGGALWRRLQALGVDCVVCDPPLQDEGVKGLSGLEAALAADVITLHTPLTDGGAYPTWHMLDAGRLGQLGAGSYLINAARGELVDNQALKALLTQGQALTAVLDVWEPEPAIDDTLMPLLAWGTPHIAGYSVEGKIRGTAMVYEACCRHFGRGIDKQLDDFLPAADVVSLEQTGLAGLSVGQQLCELILAGFDVLQDANRFVAALEQTDEAGKTVAFDQCRKHYPSRRELTSLEFNVPDASNELRALAEAAGLTLV